MKINKIEYNPPIANSGCFKIYVNFSCSEEEVPFFGTLGDYYSAVEVPDVAAYEAHYNDPDNTSFDTEPLNSTFSVLKWRKPSAYDLGLCKRVNVIGSDNIKKEDDGTYTYQQYISQNYITEAAVKQLAEMKSEMDRSYCRWGNFPDQVGCFRSGSPISDFIGILDTLDRFWD